MTWSFPRVTHTQFARNPLTSTDIELRFHPVMLVGQKEKIALYQDAVREHFPRYKRNNIRGVIVDPTGSFGIQDELEHAFIDRSNSNSIILGQQTLRTNSCDHQNRAQLRDQFLVGLNALKSVFGAISCTRLGVRYVNIITKQKISHDLNENLEWGDLISEEFLNTPHEIISNLDETNFLMEMSAGLENNAGELSLRYGLSQEENEEDSYFRFDIDRYIDLDSECNLDSQQALIDEYTLDIYSLFTTVIGPKLEQWMQLPVKEDSHV